MIGILVVTHSRLADELIHAAEMIIGSFDRVEPISINRDDSIEEAKQLLQQSFDRVGCDGDGVIILTDMFGGTPTNISAEFLVVGKVEILTGVNLPMLLKCNSARNGLLVDSLAGMLKDYARNAVMRPSELLGG